jgi:Tfp pilus assembly protein PilF
MLLKWRLSHIQGYLELGLVGEAAAELRHIPVTERREPAVLGARMAVLQAQEKWGPLRQAARAFVRRMPDDPAGWITWAYAARRSISLEAAEEILRTAVLRHPQEATIHFNLGCYASVRGDQKAASHHVARAIAIDPAFKELAATDPDLTGLRGWTRRQNE